MNGRRNHRRAIPRTLSIEVGVRGLPMIILNYKRLFWRYKNLTMVPLYEWAESAFLTLPTIQNTQL